MKNIKMPDGCTSVIDDIDEPMASRYRWWCGTNKYSKTHYACAHARVNGKRSRVKLHRLITDAPARMVVDHIDGDGLNNTRSNLRIVTHAMNIANSPARGSKYSRFKGVCFNTKKRYWWSKITVAYKQIPLGRSASAEEAARKYDIAALKYFGVSANTNFPKEQYA